MSDVQVGQPVRVRRRTESFVAVSEKCYKRCGSLSGKIGEAAVRQLEKPNAVVAVVCEHAGRLGCNAIVTDYADEHGNGNFFTVGDGEPRARVNFADDLADEHGALSLVEGHGLAK